MNREDFDIIKTKIIYFDNGATTLKPKNVVKAINDYYTKYTANAHRGAYDNSFKVDVIFENARDKIKKFINAKNTKEIIFTKGATESLNMIVFGFMKYYLKAGDEVLLTKSEHASNILPWLELEKENNIIIKYVPLDQNHKVTIENVNKMINEKTKVISLAYITNVIGDIRPIKEIVNLAHDSNILVVVDGAQSVAHIKTDVINDDIDFLAFSGHKMLGPTGIGVLYGKQALLDKMKPLNYGGGMNSDFFSDGSTTYKELPYRLEAGTSNIAGVIGLGTAIDYINKVGMNKIHEHELKLKKYLISKLKEMSNIKIYNEDSESGIITFNVKDIFPQDVASYLNHYKICIRAGNHCAKILKDELNITNTCRISFYLYNDKNEIDYFINCLKDIIDIFKIIL